MFPHNLCFNTSHVTLYRYLVGCDLVCCWFQYISCYSLSSSPAFHRTARGGFNTSHVTLYQHLQYLSASSPAVSIHLMLLFIRENRYGVDWICQVSIHLMLLFIGNTTIGVVEMYLFQYISCYSLSCFQYNFLRYWSSFNTSHVTLYPSFYRLFFF